MKFAVRMTNLLEIMKEAANTDGFESMRPVDRQHIADLLRYIADKADPKKPDIPKQGLLHDLRMHRSHD